MRRVLEAHRRVERARGHHLPQLLARRFHGLDLHLRELGAQALDGLGDHGRERARERAHAQRLALGGGQLGDLRAGLREAVGDRVGVGEQQRARLGRRRAAGTALEQLQAELALERGDLLGDRRLRQRQRLAGARERPLMGDLAERQEPPRIHIELAYSTGESINHTNEFKRASHRPMRDQKMMRSRDRWAVPGRTGRRRDPPGVAHHPRRRRVRGDDLGPPVPAGAGPGVRGRRAGEQRRRPVRPTRGSGAVPGARPRGGRAYAPWHFLNFLPDPHQHGSLRPSCSCSSTRRCCTTGEGSPSPSYSSS